MRGRRGAPGRDGRYGGAFSSVIAGIGDLFTARRTEPLLREEDRIDGKSCLVTGASSGLGFAVACELVRRGGRVVVASRTAGTELAERIHETVGRTRAADAAGVQAEPLDLSRLESVADFVERLKEQELRLDIAVFNAAVVAARSRETPDGFDEMVQVNFLGTYLLVRKLLEAGVIATGHGGAGRPRLVFVSSEAHRSSPDISPENPVAVEPYGMSGSMRYYGYSKLLLTTFTEELARRLGHGTAPRIEDEFEDDSVDNSGNRPGLALRNGPRHAAPDNDGEGPAASVLTLCPGAMNTGIAREAPGIFQPLLRGVFNLFFRSPEEAAAPVVYLAVSPEIERRTGDYLHLTTRKEKDPRALDPETGARLWRQSERLLRRYFSQSSPG